eukprot:JP445931.1.p1 GENE.JP445931.1~~JP445931.1.p1  ORF type:complete len:307 (+),score=-74.72 JP445931.1:2347-3267(+)
MSLDIFMAKRMNLKNSFSINSERIAPFCISLLITLLKVNSAKRLFIALKLDSFPFILLLLEVINTIPVFLKLLDSPYFFSKCISSEPVVRFKRLLFRDDSNLFPQFSSGKWIADFPRIKPLSKRPPKVLKSPVYFLELCTKFKISCIMVDFPEPPSPLNVTIFCRSIFSKALKFFKKSNKPICINLAENISGILFDSYSNFSLRKLKILGIKLFTMFKNFSSERSSKSIAFISSKAVGQNLASLESKTEKVFSFHRSSADNSTFSIFPFSKRKKIDSPFSHKTENKFESERFSPLKEDLVLINVKI